MTRHTYYKFLRRLHLNASDSKFDEAAGIIYTRIDDFYRTDNGYVVNGVPVSNVKVEAITKFGYTHSITLSGETHIVRPSQRNSRKSSDRIPMNMQRVMQWVGYLIADKYATPFDEFDLDHFKEQKLVMGGAIKYATHSTPLIDTIYRPGIGIVRGLLSYGETSTEGLTKEEVENFLAVHRKGERADWWFFIQIMLKYGSEGCLDEAPFRTVVEYKKEGMLLTIPIAYPETSGTVKHPGSRVYDPF